MRGLTDSVDGRTVGGGIDVDEEMACRRLVFAQEGSGGRRTGGVADAETVGAGFGGGDV